MFAIVSLDTMEFAAVIRVSFLNHLVLLKTTTKTAHFSADELINSDPNSELMFSSYNLLFIFIIFCFIFSCFCFHRPMDGVYALHLWESK